MEFTLSDPDPAERRPLVVFYDCETTGLRIPGDVILEIGATVVDYGLYTSPEDSKWTFSKLVNTSNSIPREGEEF